jgi:SAM-dependent methyltransferase
MDIFKKTMTRLRRYSNPKQLLWRLKVGNKKFVLHEYKKEDGTFDYEAYKKIQNQGNHGKLEIVNAQKEDIGFLATYIKQNIASVSSGVCHGTRRGLEQKWFTDALGANVLGTEIADTATDFPNTVQWDFHEDNSKWHNTFNFVYTNSFDHAYNPKKALDNWMKTLKNGGVCIIEHSLQQVPAATSELDPFGASLDIMPFLVLQWSEGKYAVREIITSDFIEDKFGIPRTYLVIMNN